MSFKADVLCDIKELADLEMVRSGLYAAVESGRYDTEIADFEGSVSSCTDMLNDLFACE